MSQTLKKEVFEMKRIIALLLAVLMMAAVFAACGSDDKKDSGSDSGKSETAKSVDLPALLDKINSEFSLSSDLKKLESADQLDRYYMISEDDIKQFAGERASSSTDFTEVVIVEANDSSAVDKIVTQLNSRLDAQRSTARSYTPEAVDLLESCGVKTNGNFVYLVINEEADGINKMIEDAIK